MSYYHTHTNQTSQTAIQGTGRLGLLVYLPFGELFIEERTTWNTPYKFSGKELDEETGYSYFGARYYDPNISIWLSVDPLSDEYPSHSPFNYALLNPIRLVDPDGTTVVPSGEEESRAYNNYKSYVNDQIAKYDSKTNKLRENGHENRANRRDENRSSNDWVKMGNELQELEDSKDTYTIRMGNNITNEHGGGNLSYNGSDSYGNQIIDVNLKVGGDFSTMQKMGHELTHAYQFETGKLDLTSTGFGGMLYDKTDEMQAYNRSNILYQRNSGIRINDVNSYVLKMNSPKAIGPESLHHNSISNKDFGTYRNSVLNDSKYHISTRSKVGL